MDYLNERQRIILSYLQEHKQVTIKVLQAQLEIPTATLYRDIHVLAETGTIQRMRGSLRLAPAAQLVGREMEGVEGATGACVQCGKPVSGRTAFPVRLESGEQLSACCPHCGLHYIAQCKEVASALATDFLYGTMVNVRQAAYVLGSAARVCCSPSVISFVDLEDAHRFEMGFGGQTLDFDQAVAEVERHMALHTHHNHTHA